MLLISIIATIKIFPKVSSATSNLKNINSHIFSNKKPIVIIEIIIPL